MWCHDGAHWYTTSSTTTTAWHAESEPAWHAESEPAESDPTWHAESELAEERSFMHECAAWIKRQQWAMYEHCFPLFYVMHQGCVIRMQIRGSEHVTVYCAQLKCN